MPVANKSRDRGKVKKENTQIQNRRSHTVERELQTDKRKDRKTVMADK